MVSSVGFYYCGYCPLVLCFQFSTEKQPDCLCLSCSLMRGEHLAQAVLCPLLCMRGSKNTPRCNIRGIDQSVMLALEELEMSLSVSFPLTLPLLGLFLSEP